MKHKPIITVLLAVASIMGVQAQSFMGKEKTITCWVSPPFFKM
jgi:hypothetical protein